MNEHMQTIMDWLPTLDDAALQRIQDAPAGKWNNKFRDPDEAGFCRCLVGHGRDLQYGGLGSEDITQQDHWASSAYGMLRATHGVGDPVELDAISPREVTDPIRAEARRLLATRRLDQHVAYKRTTETLNV